MICARCGARVGAMQVHDEDDCERRLASLAPDDDDGEDVFAGLLPKETRERRGPKGTGERR